MDKRYYNRYKSLLEKLNYTYKGYNVKHLVPGYFTFLFSDDAISARDVFKEFYIGTQITDLGKVLDSKSNSVISFLIDRDDYKDLANSVKAIYPDSSIVKLSGLPNKKVSFLSFSYIRHLLKATKLIFKRSIKESFMTKLFLVGLITKLFNQIHALEKTSCPENIKRYICFNAAYKEESLLTLYFKNRGIETISMQHGIFCDFKLIIPFDYINFDNMIADKLLCWGQSTVDYLTSKGIDQSRLILIGNPKYKDLTIEHVDQSFTKCLVLLGRAIYIPSNEKLLLLLKEFNKKHNNKILYYIKKHPFLMDVEHKSFASISDNMIFLGREHSVQEVLRSDMVNFTIAVNTTAYYESLALGKISLRWSESENEEFIGMDDKFVNLSEFESKLKEFSEKPETEVRQEMKDIIKYVFNPELT
ncbi:hypothetical protein G7050_03580 [Dysgonomonas sp. HDW5A]|uniref:hypothetical protein n=1 Tax=Dysgonomonas sp. HDW5A TaxID=2714926 RepID=UPI00140A1D9B|nr:hypothetical protein [Dysgonomonas sp. HDW5A]QIK58970.1 hypothetical protein G7050_03580 [Dysgonomonas sp. HDW5A]